MADQSMDGGAAIDSKPIKTNRSVATDQGWRHNVVASRERAMICFAGPLGSSDHRVIELFGFTEFDPLPMPSVEEVIFTVSTTPGLLGVLPIENSTEGELTLTLDRLIFDADDALIVGEAVLAEEIWGFSLNGEASVHTAVSHSMILDLCADFIRHRGLSVKHAVSTKAACDEVVNALDVGLMALAPPSVGAQAGLNAVETQVARVSELRTRYALIANSLPAPTGADRTMLAIVPRYDAVGALSEIAGQFKSHDVNMTSILSRPLAGERDVHCFVVVADGHAHAEPVRSLLRSLLRAGHQVKLMGCYPRWTAKEVVTPSTQLPRGVLAYEDSADTPRS
jgi:chorismate mutase/prephenate dehydratase